MSHVDRVSKRPRVDAEVSGSMSPPWIIIGSPVVGGIVVLFILFFFMLFLANLFILAGLLVFEGHEVSLNRMVNMIREETEEVIAIAWGELTEERNSLREL